MKKQEVCRPARSEILTEEMPEAIKRSGLSGRSMKRRKAKSFQRRNIDVKVYGYLSLRRWN